MDIDIKVLKKILNIPTDKTNGVRKCSSYLFGVLKKLRFNVECEHIGENYILLAKSTANKQKTILFYSHYDVKPAYEKDWLFPPFKPTLCNGRLYARGAGDAKGQLFALLKAISRFKGEYDELDYNIGIILDGGEENGSFGLDVVCKKYQTFFNAEIGFLLDSHWKDANTPIITTGTRGQLSLIVLLGDEFINNPVHAGTYGGTVNGAARYLVHALVNIEKQEFYKSVYKSGGAISICGISCGALDKGIIPVSAAVNIDIRTTKEKSNDDLLNDVINYFKYYNGTVTVRQSCEAFKFQGEDGIVELVRNTMVKNYNCQPEILSYLSAYVPLEKLQGLDADFYILPLAQHDENNHASNENISLNHIVMGEKLLYDLIVNLHDKRGGEKK